MNDDADTVTPLDGDGENVTGLHTQFQDDDSDVNAEQEGTSTEGMTRVATRRGHVFVLPQGEGRDVEITHEGMDVPEAIVDRLIEASNGRIYRVGASSDKEGE